MNEENPELICWSPALNDTLSSFTSLVVYILGERYLPTKKYITNITLKIFQKNWINQLLIYFNLVDTNKDTDQ